jgi:hypothetical protein
MLLQLPKTGLIFAHSRPSHHRKVSANFPASKEEQKEA